MSGGSKKRLWESAIMALLQCSDIRSAAKAAQISEVCLYRWLKDPEFSEEYREARQKSLNITINKLQQHTGIAVETLIKVAKDSTSPSSCRVSAAKAIIELSLKAAHIEDLKSRIESVENNSEDLAKIMEEARKRVINGKREAD